VGRRTGPFKLKTAVLADKNRGVRLNAAFVQFLGTKKFVLIILPAVNEKVQGLPVQIRGGQGGLTASDGKRGKGIFIIVYYL